MQQIKEIRPLCKCGRKLKLMLSRFMEGREKIAGLNKWNTLICYVVNANTTGSLNLCWTDSWKGEEIASNRLSAAVTFRLPDQSVLFYIIVLLCRI